MTSRLMEKSDLACEQCRRRKSRCDRLQPKCGSCVRADTPCLFTEERPKRGPKKGQLRALKAQVGKCSRFGKPICLLRTEHSHLPAAVLERQLAEQSKTETTIPDPGNDPTRPHDAGEISSSVPASEDMITGTVSWLDDLAATWDDQLLELPEISGSTAESPKLAPMAEDPGLSDMVQADLDALYFERVHPFVPIIHKGRYFSWCSQQSPSPVRRSLRLAMWTIAAAMSAPFQNLSEGLYGATRQALHALDGNDHDLPWMTGDIQLEEIQAWLLLAHYEFIRMEAHHVLLTSARVFRLVQLAQLHAVDAATTMAGKEVQSAPLAFSETQQLLDAMLEEKRRTFWAAFCFDRLLNAHDSLSFTLQEEVVSPPVLWP
ncbi:all development altered-6 [Colletotrichum orchidophilum]|uniref:All development altered-6 n=1 Tax=Colletotrichum orchidophilum TaxID=1209926 RepID=A0A1G4B583_9PEZI|nr:all development altered-6 [Colletotrichum orchidophilum]OHE96496.1 all development altered-6 [Colletotrichum orchidophilum]